MRGNPRTLRQLLGLRKATPAVLDFIRTTRAVQRTQRLEEEMRKRKPKKNEIWGLNEHRLQGDNEVADGDGEEEGGERGGERLGGVRFTNMTGSNEWREDVIEDKL